MTVGIRAAGLSQRASGNIQLDVAPARGGGAGTASQPVRILIVEDEALIAFELERLLTQFGYEVCGLARSAAEAVRMAGDQQPDLVLMDIRLANNSDGVAAAQEIRDRFGIPSVYLTAHSDPATLARAEATQPLGFATKPYSISKLKAVLEDAVEQLGE